jgi:single-stranded-DNA-specific exonuclease
VPRSPLLPTTEPVLHCPEPRAYSAQDIAWRTLETLNALLPSLSGNVLLYGDQRPYVSVQDLSGQLTYDRPQGTCPNLLLWTLPPSWTHLRWLIALTQPTTVYVRNRVPKLPDSATLRSQLSFQLVKQPEAKLNLLDLGQKWWVAPSTLVAALREMDYSCPSFGLTASLEQELQQLKHWYECPAQQLAELAQRP